MVSVRFAFLAVLAVVSGAVLSGLVLGGGVASAEKTIHVDAASVDEVQGSCLQRGGVGMSSMVFLIREEGETRKPDITVTIDTDGNGTA
ncbi:MAG TPA: hypothetical protein VFX19_10240, partial [Dehalococcoidia bacterium]|nr:hypothetical protein [Dehalococcoidia bacterium]